MTKEEIKKLIREILEEENKNKEPSTYNKVELMLEYYNSFKKKIQLLQEELNYVVIKKQVNYDVVLAHKYEHLSDFEKVELKKEELKSKILRYENVIDLVDLGVNGIKNDKYYDLIVLKYLENYSVKDIIKKLEIDRSTYFRNKNRLLLEISNFIFPDEILKKIL